MGAKVAKEDFVMVAKEAKVAKDMAFSVAKETREQDLPVAMTTTVARVAKVAKEARVAKDMHITKMALPVSKVASMVVVASPVVPKVARVEMEEDLVLKQATTVAKVVKAALV